MSTYEKIIDQLVSETRIDSVYAKRAAENLPFPVESEQSAFNVLLSLTNEQRKLLSEILLEERNSSIHDVLAVLSWWIQCRGVGLSVNDKLIKSGISGMGMHGDYIGRINNWVWPENEA